MFFVSTIDRNKERRKKSGRILLPAAMIFFMFTAVGRALPARLVLALDGVAYRDMKALQAGITCTNFWGKTFQRRAFTDEEGYFPVSRMISTFPSASDVAWTDIFGDRPLPGYQRTYYSAAANSIISINGVTTTMEHEHQMDWQLQNGFLRAMGYLYSAHTFREEMYGGIAYYWKTTSQRNDYYIYMRASDDAQHLDRDIFALLCELDGQLQKMRARYKAREGRDLEIVILSDHGHNHAGRGPRIEDAAFLEKAGYHVATAIVGPKDVVLPIVGIESWVELHCAPSETEKLAQRLCQLKGAEVVTATLPNHTNCFLVMNAKGERAEIQWKPAQNFFRYSCQTGDPINYRSVVEALGQDHQLDADGFAGADVWMAATMTNHYPLAPERIVRGLTRGALNPATILISLDNHYVNDNWFTEKGSRLVTCRSTHGGLDDLCSDGILLSNFTPTHDTSTARVASQFEDFHDVRNFRTEESGGEWVTKEEQALVRLAHVPFDQKFQLLPGDGAFLRIWSPQLAGINLKTPIIVVIEKARRYSTTPSPRQVTLEQPLLSADSSPNERIYAAPAGLKLEPQTEYEISGWVKGRAEAGQLFGFSFHTNKDGTPAAF
jgi:hypothetical protein